ncbi:hypothetical protein EVAR_44336_1 [Eumeta japonica]|uniref:Uncharacterized protein n=1 Tax=Eumeta variegata TaxID=151549 RepID=A0A4C1XBH9_EUMVA|nr:hypothetical protein EVAR_44336_1 [Eumeta japonica]
MSWWASGSHVGCDTKRDVMGGASYPCHIAPPRGSSMAEHDIQHVGSESGVSRDMRWLVWSDDVVPVLFGVLQQLLASRRDDSRTLGGMLGVKVTRQDSRDAVIENRVDVGGTEVGAGRGASYERHMRSVHRFAACRIDLRSSWPFIGPPVKTQFYTQMICCSQ